MRIKTRFLIISVALLLFTYMGLAFGIFDMIFIKPSRSVTTNGVKQASHKMPPDWTYLLNHLSHPDWFVVAVTLAQVAELQNLDHIPPEMVDAVLTAIFANLGEHGHWWRFGWDREDPEFEQFRSQQIETASRFVVVDLLPYLISAAQDNSPIRRKTACLIIGEITKVTNEPDQDHMNELYVIINTLAQSDPDPTVKSVCVNINAYF